MILTAGPGGLPVLVAWPGTSATQATPSQAMAAPAETPAQASYNAMWVAGQATPTTVDATSTAPPEPAMAAPAETPAQASYNAT